MEHIIARINDTDIWLPFKEFNSKMNIAWKAIIRDNENTIAVLHSIKYWWYELPWWHIDKWENEIDAVIRECKEEIWCDVSIQNKIGIIIEERFREKYKKTSHYFIWSVIGEKGKSQFMESEVDEQLEILRIPTEDLMKTFAIQDTKTDERKFVQLRDQHVINEFLIHNL